MKKHRISLVGAAFAALIILVIAFLARLTMYQSPEVRLPEPESGTSGGDVVSGVGQESIRRVEVTPETVQLVIERLKRPESYSRTIVIERYWSGGSGRSTAQVCVADGWTRVDVSDDNGETRHVITGDGRSWIWYGSGEKVFSAAATLNADEEQSIPTYENILAADRTAIAVADYRELEGVSCIYVETRPDASGYSERWWVSVDSGLLVAAERVNGESVVYRMAGMTVETASAAQAFQLPSGEVIYQPDGTENEEIKTEG